MGPSTRAEIAGGLYHVITPGNNRRQIFNAPADYERFLSLVATQKSKLPFFLYAYCLMTNHVHLNDAALRTRVNRNKPEQTGVRLAICAIRAPLNFPKFTLDSMQSLSMSE